METKTRHYFTIYIVLDDREYQLFSLSNFEACERCINNELKQHFKDSASFRIKEFVETTTTVNTTDFNLLSGYHDKPYDTKNIDINKCLGDMPVEKEQ